MVKKVIAATLVASAMLLGGCSVRLSTSLNGTPAETEESSSAESNKNIFSNPKEQEERKAPDDARVSKNTIEGHWIADDWVMEVTLPNSYGMVGVGGFSSSNDCTVTDSSILDSSGDKVFDYEVTNGDNLTISVEGMSIKFRRANSMEEYEAKYNELMESMWGEGSESSNYSGASTSELSNFTVTYEGPYSTAYEENFTKYEIDVWDGESLSMEDIRSGSYSSDAYPLTGKKSTYTIGNHTWVILEAGKDKIYKYFCYPEDTHSMSAEVSDYYGYTMDMDEVARLLKVFYADK